MRKHFLSLAIVSVFVWLAIASTTIKKHYVVPFQTSNKVEEASPQGNYLDKWDGSRVYGSKIKFTGGLFTKAQMKIDDQAFPAKEIQGYRQDDKYYIRHGNEFIRRIVHGKINVYLRLYETSSSYTSQGRTYHSTTTRSEYYSQVGGDKGDLILITGNESLLKLVAGCPKAEAMASLSDKEMRKAARKNRNFLNEIIETYNRGCQ